VRTKIRHITNSCFLVLAILPVVLASMLYIAQMRARHRNEKKLEHALLHTVTVPGGQLRWAVPGKEVWIGAELFDVKTIHQTADGSYQLTGLFDAEESLVVKQIRSMEKKDANQNSRLLDKLFKMLGASARPPDVLVAVLVTVPAGQYYDYCPSLCSQFKACIAPPPKA